MKTSRSVPFLKFNTLRSVCVQLYTGNIRITKSPSDWAGVEQMFPSRALSCKKLANTSLSSFGSISSILFTGRRQNTASQRRCLSKVRAAKEFYFNKDGSTTKKLQIGVNKLGDLVGVTLGPRVKLEDPAENIGAKLVRQAAVNTNDLADDGTTTSVVLAQGLIEEGVKVRVHDVLLRGVSYRLRQLVQTRFKLPEVEDSKQADVGTVSVGNNYEVRQMIVEVMSKIVTLKAPGFRECKSQYLDDITIFSGVTVIREKAGLSWTKLKRRFWAILGRWYLPRKYPQLLAIEVLKMPLIRVSQIQNLIGVTEQNYEKEKLNERIAKLSGGVAVIQTIERLEHKLKEKKLRVENVLNATKLYILDNFIFKFIFQLNLNLRLLTDNNCTKNSGRSRYCQEGFELSTEVDCQK
ncbi:hypothetical protein GIB67_039297 [Kingdonia uniflora]|uniref:Uncharacterized protein n=1 Tax=Kingdonia uniflora TaxID=39325 RepID=A0A7J7MM51_9MAGN|nr:hypothetical protein GIB67_039297 [Kingdonia uniflora]